MCRICLWPSADWNQLAALRLTIAAFQSNLLCQWLHRINYHRYWQVLIEVSTWHKARFIVACSSYCPQGEMAESSKANRLFLIDRFQLCTADLQAALVGQCKSLPLLVQEHLWMDLSSLPLPPSLFLSLFCYVIHCRSCMTPFCLFLLCCSQEWPPTSPPKSRRNTNCPPPLRLYSLSCVHGCFSVHINAKFHKF